MRAIWKVANRVPLVHVRSRFFARERGLAFVEILLGVAIMAGLAVSYLNGMSTTFKAIVVSQEVVMAESLAKSQIENMKVQGYVFVADYNPDDPANRYEVIDVPADLVAAGYSVEILTPQVVIEKTQVELQSVSINVTRDGLTELLLTTYRVSDREE